VKRATYADLLTAPKQLVAQLIDGRLLTHAHLALLHTRLTSRLGMKVDNPFDRGKGGPGDHGGCGGAVSDCSDTCSDSDARLAARGSRQLRSTQPIVKFLSSQLSYLLGDPSARQNLKGFVKYLVFLALVITAFTVTFHYVAEYEGKSHSWLTGLYWTLTVMSTLGFGDITFESDVGRGFSIIVLIAGIILLLVVLPFAFIRFFYAPWLEAQLRFRAPRSVPESVKDHVLLCPYNPITAGLVQRLTQLNIPHYVLEPDPAKAAAAHAQHIPVISGELDSEATFVAAGATRARAVFTHLADAANTNITLTVREVSATIPVIATAEFEESVDVLELAGATHVLPLKKRLGEQLAVRVNARHCEAHVVGRFQDLLIAEFPVHNTPLVGRTIREARLTETCGVSMLGVWERGQLTPAQSDTTFSEWSVPVVVGTEAQIAALNREVELFDVNENPVLVIGGGKVGQAAIKALKRRGVTVHLVEHDPAIAAKSEGLADKVVVGEGAELEILREAGIERAPSVVLTTNDDATNIYLCIYCRRLNANLRIVSRITLHRNVEAIHRAGADLVLSYASLAEESVLALIRHRELIFIGEGVRFFSFDVPKQLAGMTLLQSAIRARTGLNIVAIRRGEATIMAQPLAQLQHGDELLATGTAEQRKKFRTIFS
jgi:Trk K+ transport system NAD-binding subunit